MKTLTTPTVDELNRVQKLWMAVQATDANAKEVCALVDRTFPKHYLSVSSDLQFGMPMIGGCVVWSEKRPIAEAVAYAKRHDIRLDAVWAQDHWTSLTPAA